MTERRYLQRASLHPKGFNPGVSLPYGLRFTEVRAAMEDVCDFLYMVNTFLVERGLDRLEEMLSGATFSGLMSELVVSSLAKQSATLCANGRHNGRPDLLPRGFYPGDGVLRGDEGIEVKASRYPSGWQGHNPERGYLMVFQYEVDLATTPVEARAPTRFVRVVCAFLEEADWNFSGRSATSRRTITASVTPSGFEKLMKNPIYLDPTYIAIARTGRQQRRHRTEPQGAETRDKAR